MTVAQRDKDVSFLANLGTLNGRTREQSAEKRCERCGRLIPRRHASERRFCGRSCAAAKQADKTRKARGICRLCGKPRPRFNLNGCSAKCAYALRKLKTRPPRRCLVCQTEYFPKGQIRLKYCSIRCYDTVRMAESSESFSCARCGKAVTRRKVRTRPKQFMFCGRDCARGFITGEKHALWRGGGDPNRGVGWVKLAASIRERDGYECRRCRLSQFENGEALAVDHIRPWRSFDNKKEANDPSNLVSLCKKCHGYKTTKIERAWLRGDRIEMQQYENAVRQ